jgi:hypothetical protein
MLLTIKSLFIRKIQRTVTKDNELLINPTHARYSSCKWSPFIVNLCFFSVSLSTMMLCGRQKLQPV